METMSDVSVSLKYIVVTMQRECILNAVVLQSHLGGCRIVHMGEVKWATLEGLLELIWLKLDIINMSLFHVATGPKG